MRDRLLAAQPNSHLHDCARPHCVNGTVLPDCQTEPPPKYLYTGRCSARSLLLPSSLHFFHEANQMSSYLSSTLRTHACSLKTMPRLLVSSCPVKGAAATCKQTNVCMHTRHTASTQSRSCKTECVLQVTVQDCTLNNAKQCKDRKVIQLILYPPPQPCLI